MADTDITLIDEETRTLLDRAKDNNFADLDLNKRAFALEYVITYDHREAAKNNGFSPNSGIKLIRDPLTSAFIKHLQDESYISNIITEDFVRTHMLSLIPKFAGEEEVAIILPSGEEISAKKFHSSELLSLLKELAKSTKFYEDGSGQGGGGVTVNIDVAALLGKEHTGNTFEQEPE